MAARLYKFEQRKKTFTGLRDLTDFASLLKIEPHKLLLKSIEPKYEIFQIPKKDGSLRLIEEPETTLKKLQKQLSKYLHAVYWFHRTDAAYGFVACPKRSTDLRGIFSNAERHLNCSYLLNIDLKDFFHQFTFQKIWNCFQSQPFDFEGDLLECLCRLCCHNGRLPMGAPSSPVLSNLCSRYLDKDLQYFAKSKGWTYTRYADDMSFSSASKLEKQDQKELFHLIENHGFIINHEKIKLSGPLDAKEVTGLIIEGHSIKLPLRFKNDLEQAINRLKHTIEAQSLVGRKSSKWVEKYQQQVQGMLVFSEQVEKDNQEFVKSMQENYKEALEVPSKFDSFSWQSFPYF